MNHDKEVELTIVGAFAIDLLFHDFYRTTFDIDVITSMEGICEYGLNDQANGVIERFIGYKHNRVLLKEFSTKKSKGICNK